MEDVMRRLKAISERLRREYGAQRVILFGSYARGDATEDSDVDILVIAPTRERFFERMATSLRTVRDLYRDLPLSPIVLRPDELNARMQRGDQFIKEILEVGVEI